MNFLVEHKSEASMDEQFASAFPRYSGAISAVTDGPPEDINQMPPFIHSGVAHSVHYSTAPLEERCRTPP